MWCYVKQWIQSSGYSKSINKLRKGREGIRNIQEVCSIRKQYRKCHTASNTIYGNITYLLIPAVNWFGPQMQTSVLSFSEWQGAQGRYVFSVVALTLPFRPFQELDAWESIWTTSNLKERERGGKRGLIVFQNKFMWIDMAFPSFVGLLLPQTVSIEMISSFRQGF